MIKYGKRKRGSSKTHPHNECYICSENSSSKSRERQRAKEKIILELVENPNHCIQILRIENE